MSNLLALGRIKPFTLLVFAVMIVSFLTIPSNAMANSDTPTNLGSIVVDCSPGELEDFSVSFSGGQGDFFVLINKSSTTACQIPTNGVVLGVTTLAVSGTATYTVAQAGSFTLTSGNQTATATVTAHPVFANQATPQSGQVIDFSCNETSGRYLSRVIYVAQLNHTVVISNDSGSRTCGLTLGSVATASTTTVPTAGSVTLTIAQQGSITVQGSGADGTLGNADDGHPLTFTFVVGSARGDVDLGPASAVGFTESYSQVFHQGGSTYDADVTVTATAGLVSNQVEILDENLNPGEPNWSLAPKIEVANVSGPDDGNATIDVKFLEGGAPATLSGLSVTIVDIDFLQYVEVDPDDILSYQLSTVVDTNLNVRTVNGQLRIEEVEDQGSNDTDQSNWVVLNFKPIATLTFTLGQANDGSASFGLLLKPLVFDQPVAAGSQSFNDEKAASASPAIQLDLQATPGTAATDNSVLIGGEGLLRSSNYTLQLAPTGTTLFSGTVGKSEGYGHRISLPAGLAPGTYTLELRSIGNDGLPLMLTQTFTVGAGGVITSIGASGPSVGLAATGGSFAGQVGIASMLILAMGLATLAYAKRRRTITL